VAPLLDKAYGTAGTFGILVRGGSGAGRIKWSKAQNSKETLLDWSVACMCLLGLYYYDDWEVLLNVISLI
jgi:hypothetical protein